jgi:pimeloyl-ACP methyl ester carboxylesterase
MRKIFILVCLFLTYGCQKEKITFSADASEVFYVENAGASMRVQVQGNTASRSFILVIHGGPGAGAFFYNTKYITDNIENRFAMVYWDQRNAGASQGAANGTNLHLGQMVDDLKKVIEVLKYRYGKEIKVFLLGHSFGGLIAADFVTTSDYQNMIAGLINVDGSHNYPLNDTLTRGKMLSVGEYEISQNRKADKWKTIVNYCMAHEGNFSLEESQQLETYSSDAENLMDSVRHVNIVKKVLEYAITDRYPLTAMVANLLYSEDSDFNKELAVTQFSSELHRVTIPVLVLWGKYDFTCPKALGEDFYNRIGSKDKKMVISDISGHDMILQDKRFFCDEINAFVASHN